MTTLHEAAQQALEALDALEAPPSGVVDHYELDRRKQALRAALAQPQIDPVDEYRKGFIAGQIDMRDREETKAEPVKPVATLIAQRDALLEALCELLADAEFLGWDTAKARAAIAKVEGKQ